MKWNRKQGRQHQLNSTEWVVQYDRLTTEFTVHVKDVCHVRRYLLFWPIHRFLVEVDNSKYVLDIRWFLLWRSRLKHNDSVVIDELLPLRRRRSIAMLGYIALVTSLKLGYVLFAS